MQHETLFLLASYLALCTITGAWASLDAEGVNDGRLIDVSDQFAFSYVSNPVLGSNGETLFFVVEQMDYEPGSLVSKSCDKHWLTGR